MDNYAWSIVCPIHTYILLTAVTAHSCSVIESCGFFESVGIQNYKGKSVNSE